ncbi:hypothetical protein ACGFJ7_31685 [Actinoplanes sp. NPDC048988]|uniref:hypothetical protein n=1 Tax=Actinoplanes sp. NPDC048988 TaxID=3363901 RepID=UPI003724A868
MSTSTKAIFSAVTSGLIAFLSALLTALQGENTGFDTVTAGQWVTATLAFFVGTAGTGAVTYQVRNRTARGAVVAGEESGPDRSGPPGTEFPTEP